MRFTFDRPYRVDSSKFAKAFWPDPTPFEDGVRKTALAFRAAAGGLEPFRQSSFDPDRTSVDGTETRGSRPGFASPAK